MELQNELKRSTISLKLRIYDPTNFLKTKLIRNFQIDQMQKLPPIEFI